MLTLCIAWIVPGILFSHVTYKWQECSFSFFTWNSSSQMFVSVYGLVVYTIWFPTIWVNGVWKWCIASLKDHYTGNSRPRCWMDCSVIYQVILMTSCNLAYWSYSLEDNRLNFHCFKSLSSYERITYLQIFYVKWKLESTHVISLQIIMLPWYIT